MKEIQNIETEKETLFDCCKGLGKTILESVEYKRYLDAREIFRRDEQAKLILREYNMAMNEYNQKTRGGTDLYADYQKLENMEKEVKQNETLKNYFDSQDSLANFYKEINEYISGKLNFNFASLAKPASSCCS